MSDPKRVNDALERVFAEDDVRVVFWNDPEKEFQNVLPFICLDGVRTVRLDENGSLAVKILLERDDPAGKFLLYSPAEEPDYDSDWLLDIRLYSRCFRADRASILLQDLGLKSAALRQHIADRRKFFDSKDRFQKLKPLVEPDDTAADLDRKMIAVAVRADQPEFFNIVRTLFHAFTEAGDVIDLDLAPPAWDQVEKFDLAAPFWETVKTTFGYSEDMPTLKKLLIRLLVTDYAHNLKGDVPKAISHLILPPQGRANAIVCLAQWRDSTSRAASYDLLSAEVTALVHLGDLLHGVEFGDLIDVMTFLDVEKAIVSGLRDLVQNVADTIDIEDVRAAASRRQASHWASPHVPGSATVPREALHEAYSALVAAAEFFALRNRFQSGFDYPDAVSLFRAYETELHHFDQCYRRFCEAADHAEAKGWNLLKSLRPAVEACYANWFVPTLGAAWGKFVDPQGSAALLRKWHLDSIPAQQDFYERHVQPRLDEAENRRVFVVISDALRYEAAQELTRELNGKYRFEATLTSQLGVVPSYTALGMASLLPHKTLDFKSNGDVLVDGSPTSSLDDRNEIMAGRNGMACRASDLLSMKKEQGREFVRGKRVVYIYHNAVDSIGDSASTEERTFEGVRTAIDQLADLVKYVVNNLNGSHVVITADHGFLFTESPPGEPEKSKLDHKPDGTVRAKKRYLLGRSLPDHDAVWHGDTKATAGAGGGMEFWIPRGANRFHFAGGARFVHGGAMLQEIVVPVVTVREVEGKSARDTKTKQVTVHVLGASHKITTNRHRFELIQVEPVSERVRAVTLKVAIYEGDEPVTNVESVTFDSTSDKMDERRKWVHLVLQDREYDKRRPYRLVLRDAESNVDQESVPVTIDRAFTDDF